MADGTSEKYRRERKKQKVKDRRIEKPQSEVRGKRVETRNAFAL